MRSWPTVREMGTISTIGRLAGDEVPAVIVLQLTPADSAGQHRHVVDVGVGDHRVAGGVRVLVLELGLQVRFPQPTIARCSGVSLSNSSGNMRPPLGLCSHTGVAVPAPG